MWPSKKFVFLLVLVIWSMVSLYGPADSQLNIEDALFLTKNSFKELKRQYFPKKGGVSIEEHHLSSSGNQGNMEIATGLVNTTEADYPLSNMVNSIFPIDSTIEFNTTKEYLTFNGRYASFSPILNFPLRDRYKIWPSGACYPEEDKNLDFEQYRDKILVVMRGDCTFVKKVEHLITYDLNPKAIIVANNEPSRGLITMYSNSFNEDRTLTVPVIFITKESYEVFEQFDSQNLLITISTTSLGNWLNIMISMMLSPPLLILLFYCLIQLIQQFRKIRRNKSSKKIVKNLPVFIYNKNHLIDSKKFYRYLNDTGQRDSFLTVSDDSGDSNSSLEADITRAKPTPSSSDASLNDFRINGTDVRHKSKDLNILIMNEDFYPTFKCSICLDRFKPLKSRVLVLGCKHFFHEKCLSNWLINFKRSCPLCNNSVVGSVSNNLIAGQLRTYGSFDDDIESVVGLIGDRESTVSVGSVSEHSYHPIPSEPADELQEPISYNHEPNSDDRTNEGTHDQTIPSGVTSPPSSAVETFVTAPEHASIATSTDSTYSLPTTTASSYNQDTYSNFDDYEANDTISPQSTIEASDSTIEPDQQNN